MKLYHSIHARGERVEDVLREAERQSDTNAEARVGDTVMNGNDMDHQGSANQIGDVPAEELEDGEVEEETENQIPVIDVCFSFQRLYHKSCLGALINTKLCVKQASAPIQPPPSSYLPDKSAAQPPENIPDIPQLALSNGETSAYGCCI